MKVPECDRHEEIVLWTSAAGLRCVVASYDERRYQLKLLRQHGTIKADLFESYVQAVVAATGWREQIDQP